MCGICCVFQENTVVSFEHIVENSNIKNRGPDYQEKCVVHVSPELPILFGGFVLHLRGNATSQPLTDVNNNVLLWNGEIFCGMTVGKDENDTRILFERLVKVQNDQELLYVMSSIKGPWTFIFWQASTSRLWFGRDVFGRRSLLWHLPENKSDVFALSSVQIKPHRFEEIPSVGLYCLEFDCSSTDSQSSNIVPRITVFPWKDGTWPGTKQEVTSTDPQDFPSKLYSVDTCFQLTLQTHLDLPTWMPVVNTELPSPEYAGFMNESKEKNDKNLEFKECLKSIFDNDERIRTCVNQFMDVLQHAVQRRVTCLPRENISLNQDTDVGQIEGVGQPMNISSNVCNGQLKSPHSDSFAKVAILFSGGIDSTVLAALADRCVPENEEIDLINVAFEQQPKQQQKVGKREKNQGSNCAHPPPPVDKFAVPDRLTGYVALSELNPNRKWNFVEVNVTEDELKEFRNNHISQLIYPLVSVLDDSIGCAVWFAARGEGILGNGRWKGRAYKSNAKVILCGMGADEQLVGYSRHMVRFRESGWEGVIKEVDMEMRRISARNLGRDDRVIGDHGRESRIPFLDEDVVAFLAQLPIFMKINPWLPRGVGEKLILRLLALELGLASTAVQPKRAIQFGSRIAKLENRKEKASDVCTRLQDSAGI